METSIIPILIRTRHIIKLNPKHPIQPLNLPINNVPLNLLIKTPITTLSHVIPTSIIIKTKYIILYKY
jgi:hypothetical protein